MESLRKLIFKDVTPTSDLFANEDCLTCEAQCDEHQAYPSYLDIKTDRNIGATTKPYSRHILIATSLTDWPKKIEQDSESVAGTLLSTRPDRSTMITATSLISTHSSIPGAQDLLVLPENIIAANVTSKNIHHFWSFLAAHKTLSSPPSSSSSPSLSKEQQRQKEKESNATTGPIEGGIVIHPNPYSALLLICSHGRRDKRCGVTSGILAREFDHVLRTKDMDDCEIVMVSHIGGHKIAGNVICYTHQGKRGIWYGLVKACHCKAIVEETLEKGRIIQSIYRGAMGNSFTEEERKSSSILSW